jgi:hypothetical protein
MLKINSKAISANYLMDVMLKKVMIIEADTIKVGMPLKKLSSL